MTSEGLETRCHQVCEPLFARQGRKIDAGGGAPAFSITNGLDGTIWRDVGLLQQDVEHECSGKRMPGIRATNVHMPHKWEAA